ncbi:hypothetical protein ONE63_009903 [Megalurothrips usitatus]|uniref:Uncharacterized protein n=1 Tax=Megalurothrips usitatus TaxID=439358 RepID=A0AAV7XH61_9NEOP|nr:hypothetical protein ONE63_009903 [Megalurothrips usitatus]
MVRGGVLRAVRLQQQRRAVSSTSSRTRWAWGRRAQRTPPRSRRFLIHALLCSQLLGGSARENPAPREAAVPRHQHSSSCGSLSADTLGPLIVGPSISVDDWVPERPPKKPHLRAAFAAASAASNPGAAPAVPALPTSLSAPALHALHPLHHHRPLWPSHCPSPDLPPPSPPPASECDVIVSDEPLPPPPPESLSPSPPPPQVPKGLSLPPSPPAVASPRVSPETLETTATPTSTPGHDRLNNNNISSSNNNNNLWRHHKTYLETSFEGSPPRLNERQGERQGRGAAAVRGQRGAGPRPGPRPRPRRQAGQRALPSAGGGARHQEARRQRGGAL